MFSISYAQKKEIINFAPLPINNAKQNIKDFIPLNSYLEESLNVKINYLQFSSYEDILYAFEEEKVDIAYLGPLPLVALQQNFSHIFPLATLKQKDGSSKYRCVLSKFKNDQLDLSQPLKISLTQPLSTCGYYFTKKLLKDDFNIDLDKQQYKYVMTHSSAMLSALAGETIIAGVKEPVAKKYDSIGMEIIAKSAPLPGFTLVANSKTLSMDQILEIQKTIFAITPETYKNWKGLFTHGFTPTDLKDYSFPDLDLHDIPQKGNIK